MRYLQDDQPQTPIIKSSDPPIAVVSFRLLALTLFSMFAIMQDIPAKNHSIRL
jgi:hypothetical protein